MKAQERETEMMKIEKAQPAKFPHDQVSDRVLRLAMENVGLN